VLLFLAGACCLIVCATGALTFTQAFPHLRNKEEDTRKLAQSFPTLERLQVRDFISDNRCNRIHYSRGWFADPLECAPIIKVGQDEWVEAPAKPFDTQAKTDFEHLKAAISSTGVPIDTIEAKFTLEDKVLTATFWLECRCYLRYTYRANYGRMMPEAVPGNLWHTRINSDWYLTDEEWN
jgi:hypothetical protein